MTSVASPNRKSTNCKSPVARRFSCASLSFSGLRSTLMTLPPSGPTEAASQMVLYPLEVPISNIRRARELRANILTSSAVSGSRFSSLRECSSSRASCARVVFELPQEIADFGFHLTQAPA